MKTLYPVPPDPSTDPAYLVAAAVQSLIHPLPSGTAFCIGVVLIVMMTGRLVQTKGSLARAVLPFVVHLRWAGIGWSARWSGVRVAACKRYDAGLQTRTWLGSQSLRSSNAAGSRSLPTGSQ